MYNGYENYETWAIALWLNNEHGDYDRWTVQAAILKDNAAEAPRVEEGIWTEAEAVRYELANEIKEAVKEGNPLADGASLYTDLLGAALGSVNWSEVANSFIEE